MSAGRRFLRSVFQPRIDDGWGYSISYEGDIPRLDLRIVFWPAFFEIVELLVRPS